MWARVGAGTVDFSAALHPWKIQTPPLKYSEAGPERLARQFHETYERLAPSFGYETRKASAKPWADVPVENKQLMIAVAEEVGRWLDVGPGHVPYASERLRLAMDALINTGHFTPAQVSDDVAPRIVELWAAKRHDLGKMIDEVRDLNTAKGWRDEERSFGDMIALLHSETSEALEAYRDHKLEDATEVMYSRQLPKPEGVGSELADVLIRLLDMADLYGINLEEEYGRKMAFNWTRPYRHGGRTL